jgi:hypothetical protein
MQDISQIDNSTMVKAVQEQDQNHFILGDLYNGNKSISESVPQAMSKYIDVLSVHYFVKARNAEATEKMGKHLMGSSAWQPASSRSSYLQMFFFS